MKKIFILLLLALLFTFQQDNIHSQNISPERLILQAFSYSGADIMRVNVNCWGVIDNYVTNKTGIRKIAEEAAASLGLSQGIKTSRDVKSNDNRKKVQITGSTEAGKTVTVMVDTILGNYDKKTYMVIDIVQDSISKSLEGIRPELVELYGVYYSIPRINSCIVGAFKGKLGYEEISKIGGDILKKSKASRVEGIYERNMISVSAYSPSIKESISVNSRKVNMNVALRYNSYENRTYIWIATPVISLEY